MLLLEIRENFLFIGAAVPVSRIAMDPLAGVHARALVDASNLIAGPQVRNVATLGGNVAHALPAADGTIALLALDARAEIAGLSGSRRVPIRDLFLGPGKSALNPGEELLVGFHLPLSSQNQSSCFKRIMRPQGVALPILNCAVRLEREGDIVKDVRIAVGPGSGTPFRATEAENALCGQSLNDGTFMRAIVSLLAQARFRTSPRRASAEYREHVVHGLFKDTFEEAWRTAG
jgi:carbon-monoxide dehydrogenase medium subunit